MPKIDTIVSSQDFPKRAAVVVIGGGVIGISTALELAERGIDVVVIEKGEVAAEQSSRNWGWCRQMGRDPREIPLILVSMDLWRNMNVRVGAETGFRQCGIAYLSENQAQMADKEAWFNANVKPFGLSTRLVNAKEAQELAPGGKIDWVGGLYTANDGRAEPFIAVPAMARALQAKGGKVFTQCAARGLEMAAGRLSGVVTERGTIATDTVVLAGGYWSRHFLGNHGVAFPQLGVVSSVMRTSAVDLGHERTFSGNRFAIRKRLDGGYTIAHNLYSVSDLTPAHFRYFMDFLPLLSMEFKHIKLRMGGHFWREFNMPSRFALDQVSPFERVRILDPVPAQNLIDDAFDAVRKAYPAFATARIEEQWGGMIDTTPDVVPVIDKVERLPGLHLASGFSGHGFGLGPGAGKLMAELVTGEKPCVDPSAFAFKRLSDGSWAKPTGGP